MECSVVQRNVMLCYVCICTWVPNKHVFDRFRVSPLRPFESYAADRTEQKQCVGCFEHFLRFSILTAMTK